MLTVPEPALLASDPEPPVPVVEGEVVYSKDEVDRMVAVAVAGAWADSRRSFKRKLAERLEELEQQFQAKRDALIAETVATTRELLKQKG